MTMWALVENGTVAEVIDTDPNGRYHASLYWVSCDGDVSPGWRYDGERFAPPASAVVQSADLCARIDAAADAARSAVVGDPVRSLEYQKAAEEARAFVAAGYPADAVPRTVAAYVTAERTARQAADSILAEEAAYNEALYFLRETRLQAKEQVCKAMADGLVEQAQTITDDTVAAIQAAVAGVGNAGA